jgi:hypothetical protein
MDKKNGDGAGKGRNDNDYLRNWRLLDILADDRERARLYARLRGTAGGVEFPSRDSRQRECDECGLEASRVAPLTGHRRVRLITRRSEIVRILRDDGTRYSNRIYAELGGGSFMLALDPSAGGAHAEQRAAYAACFPHRLQQLIELSHFACQAASVMALKAPDFDLAAFAEQTAVRFCQKLLGYSFRDYTRLERSLQAAYRGLVYQVLGRHFVSDPTAVPAARQALAALLARTSELIDAYATDDEDALKGCKDLALPAGLVPVLKKLGRHGGPMNGEQRAILAVGAAVGTVGNVQAAACIAVKAMFADRRPLAAGGLFEQACKLARQECGNRPTRKFPAWQGLIQNALRDNPPIPFLPRMEVDAQGNALGEVLLALGGGTLEGNLQVDDPLVWGRPNVGTHWCAGEALAWPLIVEIVRQVMLLPALAERLDPRTRR